jgi:DNA repair exonuclease SbcCD ATPase subunit
MLVSALRYDDVVTGCTKEIKENVKDYKVKVDSVQTKIGVLQDSISKHSDENTYEESIKKDQKRLKELDDLLSKIDGKMGELSKAEEIRKVKIIKEEIESNEKEIKSISSQKESQLKEWQDHYDNSITEITNKENDIENTNKRLKEATKRLDDKTKSIEDFDLEVVNKKLATVKKAEEAKPKREEQFEKTKSHREKILISITEQKTESSRIIKEIESLKEQVDKAGDNPEFVCDKCKSKVTKDHIESEIKANESKVKDIQVKIDTLNKEISEDDKQLEAIKEKLNNISEWVEKKPKLEAEIKSHEENKVLIKELKDSTLFLDKDILRIKDEIEKIEIKKKDYSDKISTVKSQYEEKTKQLEESRKTLKEKLDKAESDAKDIQDKINKIEEKKKEFIEEKSGLDSSIGQKKQIIKDIKGYKDSLEEARKEQKEVESWYTRYLKLEGICGIEGVQTRIVKKWLPLLNIHIKEVLSILTDGIMDVEFFVDDRGKVGIVIRGGSASTYEMSSGGEKMIIRLAVDISLGLLLFSRTTSRAEMIVLDEIFGPLDPSKVNSVFELLEVLKDKFKRVLVISHKEEINKKIPTQIIVEKDAGAYGLSKIMRMV